MNNKTFVANALDKLIEEFKIGSAAEISRRSKVDAATLSRVRNGQQSFSPEDLDAVAKSISSSRNVHARLLYAHLQDQLRSPGGDLISIKIRGGGSKPSKPETTKLPPRLARNIEIISKNLINNPGLRRSIEGLASLCR